MNEDEEIKEILREILKWTKVTSIPKVKELLLGILESPEEMIAYQSSDGEKNRRKVADQANVSQSTVSKWWRKWIKAGIAEPVSVQRGERAMRIFSIGDFGLEVPTIEKRPPKIKEKNEHEG